MVAHLLAELLSVEATYLKTEMVQKVPHCVSTMTYWVLYCTGTNYVVTLSYLYVIESRNCHDDFAFGRAVYLAATSSKSPPPSELVASTGTTLL